jgi:hypothetical protein
MKWTKKVKLFFLVVTVCLVCLSCVQTKTLTTNSQKLNQFNRPDYIGTFSAMYYIDSLRTINIDTLKTLYAIHKNDSLIRKRVRFLSFGAQKVNATNATEINVALINCLNYTLEKETIKGYTGSLKAFEEIGNSTTGNYNIYFISIGYSKHKNIALTDRVIKTSAVLATGLSVFLFGYVGYIAPVIIEQNVGNSLDKKPKKDETVLNFPGAYSRKQSLSGFVVVYDKVKKEICYVREQFFAIPKSPVSEKAIKKQVKNAFKELYK